MWIFKSLIISCIIVITSITILGLFSGADLLVSIKNTTLQDMCRIVDLSFRTSYWIFIMMVLKYFHGNK
jgi:hypothetical protein